MSESVECVVIGAGVVGLAVARSLALAGHEVVVLDKNAHIGEETSSRNSEVIHAGIYYPTGSLKARLCVAGKEFLYEYCRARDIAHSRCGKLIVAVEAAQTEKLRAIERQAAENGVHDLERIDAATLNRLEPELRGVAALRSPSTGVVDVHGFMLALQADLEHAGGSVVTSTEFVAGALATDGLRLTIATDGSDSEVAAKIVINAAGLHATRTARALLGAAAHVPETRYAKGNYFTYRGPSPFSQLVYPLPEPGGLGIHATLDLAGKVRFGPDVEWIEGIDYTVDASRAAKFYEAIRGYWPGVRAENLTASYAGVRPKLGGPRDPAADFWIAEATLAGPARVVNLLGIESPGLTSALAIGAYVVELLRV